MAKREKVISLADREQEKKEREATLYCEVMAKDDPSPEARAYFDAQLDESTVEWRRHGDLTADALDYALKGFWLGYATQAAVKRGAEALRRELGHEEAPAAERVLIEHAVLCHARLGIVEHLYSRATSGSSNVNTVEHYERRLTLAQRRFTRAVTTLARVRGLLARAEAAREAASKARNGRALAVLKQLAG